MLPDMETEPEKLIRFQSEGLLRYVLQQPSV